MKLVKEMMYIFSKNQKIKLFLLFVMIAFGTFAELIGVTAVLPAIQIAMNPNIGEEEPIFRGIMQIFHLKNSTELLGIVALGIIIIFVAKNLYLVFMYSVEYRFIYNNQKRLAVRMMKAYMERPYMFHLSRNTAELQRNVNLDTAQFYAVIMNGIQVLIDVLLVIVLACYLFYTDVFMALGSMCFIAIFMVAYYKLSKRKSVSWGERYHDANANAIQWLNQAYGGIKEIKITHREKLFEKAYENACTQYTTASRQLAVQTMIPKCLLETVVICGIMFVIIIEILLGMDISKLVESLAAFAVAVFKMVPSANRINGSINGILFQIPSVHTVYECLREIEQQNVVCAESERSIEKLQFIKKIEVKKISYHYPDVDENVLEDVELSISRGESVAFIGESGSGKSTLADIILGVLEPQKGEVTVDGVNIQKSMYGWHKLIGYIPQSIYLIDDSIRNNIAFGVPENEIDESALRRAISQAQLTEFIDSLDEGLDTIVGEQGVRLSGGQRQRIGIARALYHDPELLVLDEATSALDQETEKAVMYSIEALQGRKTLIIIAHRLSTIESCDTVYEIRDKKAWKK